jgi:hypothetical protein
VTDKAVKASVTGESFEADYAIVVNEADNANVANEADDTNEAIGASAADRSNEAKAIVVDEVNEIIEANEANVIDKIVAVNKIAEVNVNKANLIVEIISADEANAVDRAIAVDRANMANEADEASLAEANKLLANGGIAVVGKYSVKLMTLLPFSLTKYFEIFAVVEGYFGLIFNNQPAGMIVVEMGRSSLSKVVCGLEVSILWSSLISLCECLESGWSKLCSLRNQYRY